MPQRGYVLIFVIWALLTLITPTLIFWSASSKPNLHDIAEEPRREMKARRMMASLEKAQMIKNRTAAMARRAPVPAPAPVPLPVMGNGTVT